MFDKIYKRGHRYGQKSFLMLSANETYVVARARRVSRRGISELTSILSFASPPPLSIGKPPGYMQRKSRGSDPLFKNDAMTLGPHARGPTYGISI